MIGYGDDRVYDVIEDIYSASIVGHGGLRNHVPNINIIPSVEHRGESYKQWVHLGRPMYLGTEYHLGAAARLEPSVWSKYSLSNQYLGTKMPLLLHIPRCAVVTPTVSLIFF